MYEEVRFDHPKCEIELDDVFSRNHEVDGNGVHGGLFGCILNESVLEYEWNKK